MIGFLISVVSISVQPNVRFCRWHTGYCSCSSAAAKMVNNDGVTFDHAIDCEVTAVARVGDFAIF